MLEQIVLVYQTFSECEMVACSSGSAWTQKNCTTEPVSVCMRHNQK